MSEHHRLHHRAKMNPTRSKGRDLLRMQRQRYYEAYVLDHKAHPLIIDATPTYTPCPPSTGRALHTSGAPRRQMPRERAPISGSGCSQVSRATTAREPRKRRSPSQRIRGSFIVGTSAAAEAIQRKHPTVLLDPRCIGSPTLERTGYTRAVHNIRIPSTHHSEHEHNRERVAGVIRPKTAREIYTARRSERIADTTIKKKSPKSAVHRSNNTVVMADEWLSDAPLSCRSPKLSPRPSHATKKSTHTPGVHFDPEGEQTQSHLRGQSSLERAWKSVQVFEKDTSNIGSDRHPELHGTDLPPCPFEGCTNRQIHMHHVVERGEGPPHVVETDPPAPEPSPELIVDTEAIRERQPVASVDRVYNNISRSSERSDFASQFGGWGDDAIDSPEMLKL